MDHESDSFLKCLKCQHHKVDHNRNTSRDKTKCMIGACECRKFIADRKYYRASKK